jgi:hypothetical protein
LYPNHFKRLGKDTSLYPGIKVGRLALRDAFPHSQSQRDWRYPGKVHAFVRTRASRIVLAVRVCGRWSADILVRLRLTLSKEADKNVRAPKKQETHGSHSARRDRLIPTEPLFSSPAHEPQNAFLDFQRLAHFEVYGRNVRNLVSGLSDSETIP